MALINKETKEYIRVSGIYHNNRIKLERYKDKQMREDRKLKKGDWNKPIESDQYDENLFDLLPEELRNELYTALYEILKANSYTPDKYDDDL